MKTDNRKRPSQGFIDMMNGDYDKIEKERMMSYSHEPIYNIDEKSNITDTTIDTLLKEINY